MSKDVFFEKIRSYGPLSLEAETAWAALLKPRSYRKDVHFIAEGEIPANFAFVVEGLFYQRYTGPDGAMVIKYFFPEYRIAASVSATLLAAPSAFAITAIEDSSVLEYSFAAFKKLVADFPDIAAFYIRYMEQHWIVEKEPEEIAFRHDPAMKRYQEFIRKSPYLLKRLKQHHIAAWLGVAPESLSRIRKSITEGA